MTDNTAATRAARYRKRQRLTDAATLNGAEILDAALVVRMPDGHYVVALYDGKPVHLVPRDDAANIDAKLDRVIELLTSDKGGPARIEREPEHTPDKPARKKAIVVPREILKNGLATGWRVLRQQIIDKGISPEGVKANIPALYRQSDSFDGDIDKLGIQIAAMVDALIEQHGDEWRAHVPEWPKEK